MKTISNKAKNRLTHGKSNSPEYRTWQHMKNRCYNPKVWAYERYGGRGIFVCKRWHKFENFYKDMGVRPQGKTLERIDNNKGYFKDNCVWADRSTQAHNRCNTIKITCNGETKTFWEWTQITGIKYTTLWMRMNVYGWRPERALEINKN